MIEHVFKADPFGRDACDSKEDDADEGRVSHCGRPEKEHMAESERGLRIQLSTALKERDEAKAAIRAAESNALERAAYIAESYGCDYAGKEIRALASSAAAPAASRPSEPAAPAPDLRCEACGDRLADEDAMRAHDRTWHGTVEAELRDRIAELEAALKKATVQIGILLDRMRGCNEEVRQGRRDKDGHDLSLFEGPAWITEHKAKLPSKPPGAGEGT